MEFQKRLYFEQEDVILGQRRKEAFEEAGRVNERTRGEVLSRWKNFKIEKNTHGKQEFTGDGRKKV